MDTKKYASPFLCIFFVTTVFVSSCSGANRDTEIAVIVALTQTAAALQQPEAALPQQTDAAVLPKSDLSTATFTPVPADLSVKGFQPYDNASCAGLNSDLSATAGLSGSLVSPVSYSDLVSGESGGACQLNYSANASAYSGNLLESASSVFTAQGWLEDPRYGAGGPGGLQTAYTQDASLCIVAYEFKPIDRALCNPDEIFATCMERLTPEQKVYKLTVTCTTYVP